MSTRLNKQYQNNGSEELLDYAVDGRLKPTCPIFSNVDDQFVAKRGLAGLATKRGVIEFADMANAWQSLTSATLVSIVENAQAIWSQRIPDRDYADSSSTPGVIIQLKPADAKKLGVEASSAKRLLATGDVIVEGVIAATADAMLLYQIAAAAKGAPLAGTFTDLPEWQPTSHGDMIAGAAQAREIGVQIQSRAGRDGATLSGPGFAPGTQRDARLAERDQARRDSSRIAGYAGTQVVEAEPQPRYRAGRGPVGRLRQRGNM